MPSYRHLPYDSGLLHVPCFRIDDDADPALLESVLSEIAVGNERYMAYFFCHADRAPAEHLLEGFGGAYVVSQRTYSKTGLASGLIDSSLASGFDASCYGIFVQSGAYSRFRIDRRLPVRVFEELYRTWFDKSVSRTMSDYAYSCYLDNACVGVVTVSLHDEFGQIDIIAVDEEMRGHGIGSKMIAAAESLSAGKRELRVVTQKENAVACRFYERNGFVFADEFEVYHFYRP